MIGTAGSSANEPVVLHAAGSLQTALTVIAQDFEAAAGIAVRSRFGPSGLLCDAILRGERVDVFASANMMHPLRLADTLGGVARPFTRNSMCALVGGNLRLDPGALIDAMLDPAVRLAISTPRSDPSGDYALAVFDRAESLRPGASSALTAKAMMLTGAPDSPPVPPDRNRYGYFLASGQADIFLTYRTNAIHAAHEAPQLQIVALPDALAVDADYGLIALSGSENAKALIDHIMSGRGQSVLERFGFLPGVAAAD